MSQEPTDPLQWGHLAEVLAAMPDTYRRILDEHADDGTGKCTACTEGGTGRHTTTWPCPVRKLAILAADISRGRTR